MICPVLKAFGLKTNRSFYHKPKQITVILQKNSVVFLGNTKTLKNLRIFCKKVLTFLQKRCITITYSQPLGVLP